MAQLSCCGVNFTNEEELARHQVKTHGQQRQKAGSCCGVDFYTKEGLAAHKQTAHTGGRPQKP